MSESNDLISKIYIKSIPELKYLFGKMQDEWIFRGQSNPDWELKTHLERNIRIENSIEEYDLNMVSLESTDAFPGEGNKLVIVAKISDSYHVRIFDKAGRIVIEGKNEFLPDETLAKELNKAFYVQSPSKQIDKKTKYELIGKIQSNLYPAILKRYKYEKEFDNEFQKRGHHFVNTSSGHHPSTILECVALMQHYNIPTRLLDCTRSPYIATYFALADSCNSNNIESEKYVAIWCFSKKVLKDCRKDIMKDYVGNNNKSSQKKIAQKFFSNKIYLQDDTAKGVLLLSPDKLNDRIMSQQGLFLVPVSLSCSFHENLKVSLDSILDKSTSNNYPDDPIVKLLIPLSCRAQLLHELNTMNVTGFSLYPDMKGFAEWLQLKPFIDENDHSKKAESLVESQNIESLKRFKSSQIWCKVTLKNTFGSLLQVLTVFKELEINLELAHVTQIRPQNRTWAFRVKKVKGDVDRSFEERLWKALKTIACSKKCREENFKIEKPSNDSCDSCDNEDLDVIVQKIENETESLTTPME